MELNDSTENNKIRIKIILIGAVGVGKTNLINVTLGKKFEQNPISTQSGSYTESQYKSKNGRIYFFDIWDTCGHEIYRSITKLFIKGSKIVLVVYSINDRESFEEIDYWINLVRENLGKETNDYILALVGNKCDLYENEQVVPDEEAINIANSYNIKFKLTSALTEAESFKLFLNELIEDYIQLIGPERGRLLLSHSIKLNKGDLKKLNKKKCCKS